MTNRSEFPIPDCRLSARRFLACRSGRYGISLSNGVPNRLDTSPLENLAHCRWTSRRPTTTTGSRRTCPGFVPTTSRSIWKAWRTRWVCRADRGVPGRAVGHRRPVVRDSLHGPRDDGLRAFLADPGHHGFRAFEETPRRPRRSASSWMVGRGPTPRSREGTVNLATIMIYFFFATPRCSSSSRADTTTGRGSKIRIDRF
jgi:hypothetical protein